MVTQDYKCKLTAILSAYVKVYSQLMDNDEEDTAEFSTTVSF